MRKYLVLLLAAAVVFMMAPAMVQAQAPASGKSVDFYAQVWWDAFYDKKDKNWVSSNERLSEWSYAVSKSAGEKRTDHTFGLNPAVTRFGANFKNGNLTGRFELRPVDGNGAPAPANSWTTSGLGTMLREAWAQYEFADLMGMKVLVGQTYTPTWVPVGMAAWGGQGKWMGDLRVVDREPMVQVQLPLGPEKSSLKVALVRPKQVNVNSVGSTAPDTTGISGGTSPFNYIENPFPKFEANYNLQINAGLVKVSATPVFGYGQEKLIVQNSYSKTVKSYIYGASATVNVGPGFLKASGHMAKNGKEYGMDQALIGATFQAANKKLNETDIYGYHLVAGATVDIFTPYISYGYNFGKRKDSSTGNKFETYQSWLSVGAKIQVLPSLLLMPEWARRDNGKQKTNGTKGSNRGKADYYGFETVIFL